MIRSMRLASGLMALTAMLSCGGSDDGGCEPSCPPESGVLQLTLTAPDNQTGAIKVTVTGGTISSITSTHRLWSPSTLASPATFIVTGALQPGVLAEITIPDRQTRDSYTVQMNEAAKAGTFEQRTDVSVSLNFKQ